MPLIAEGPLANSVITIRQVIPVVSAGDLPAVATGNGRSDVTALLDGADPNSIVGRDLDVSTPASPALVAVTPPTAVAAERERIKDRLRQLEATPQLAAWSGTDGGERARSFSRWIEMIGCASSEDINLTTANSLALIHRELAHDGRTWYWLHYLSAVVGQTATPTGAAWSGFLSTDSGIYTPTVFYATVGPDAIDPNARTSSVEPNTRGGVFAERITAGTIVRMNNAATFNLAAYLGS